MLFYFCAIPGGAGDLPFHFVFMGHYWQAWAGGGVAPRSSFIVKHRRENDINGYHGMRLWVQPVDEGCHRTEIRLEKYY